VSEKIVLFNKINFFYLAVIKKCYDINNNNFHKQLNKGIIMKEQELIELKSKKLQEFIEITFNDNKNDNSKHKQIITYDDLENLTIILSLTRMLNTSVEKIISKI
jgi:Fe-S cluster assembly ATPase SufC